MLAIFLTCANVFDETSFINESAQAKSHNSMVIEVGVISRSYLTKLECIYIFFNRFPFRNSEEIPCLKFRKQIKAWRVKVVHLLMEFIAVNFFRTY